MKIKHKVLKEFHYVTPNKKIVVLNKGIILDEFVYKFKDGDGNIKLDRDIIDNNPDFFEVVDWKAELYTYIKANKIPQPKSTRDKLEPFIQEMILSSMDESNDGVVDKDKIKELDDREYDLNRREIKVEEKEDEISRRLERLATREQYYKNDLDVLDSKEDKLREDSKLSRKREIELDNKASDLKKKEREIDRTKLKSSDLDKKYKDLQISIDKDIEEVSIKESDLEKRLKEIEEYDQSIKKKESVIEQGIRDMEIKRDELDDYNSNIKKAEKEIEEWENKHWKLKRMKQQKKD